MKLPPAVDGIIDSLPTFAFDDLPEELRFARFLKVRCATGREFVLGVPLEMRTAREANAWTYQLHTDDYPLDVRT